MMRALCRLLGALVLLTGLACASSPYQKNGASCPAAVCSSHGTCTYENTYPTCACAAGYQGMVCSLCATGFHRGAGDACVADETCSSSQCANGGTCAVVQGLASCTCAGGYTGATCTTCGTGFHQVSADGGVACSLDEDCLPATCSGEGMCSVNGGVASCLCKAGFTGTYCEQPDSTCALMNPCSANGTCSDTGGVVTCICAAGWGDPTCSSCYPGYHQVMGACVLDTSCEPATCSFAGTCSADGGMASCACNAGYTGSACDSCAAGFVRDSGHACVAIPTCAANQCGSNGACVVSGAQTLCTCATGWAGLACDTCYPGYHSAAADGGTACVLDTQCEADTCLMHGSCQADGGTVTCTCDPGYSGNNCETGTDNCTNNACGSGQCVDQPQGYACLCTNNTWGMSCP